MRYAAIAAAAMVLLLISGCAAKPGAIPPVTPTPSPTQTVSPTPATEETFVMSDLSVVSGLSPVAKIYPCYADDEILIFYSDHLPIFYSDHLMSDKERNTSKFGAYVFIYDLTLGGVTAGIDVYSLVEPWPESTDIGVGAEVDKDGRYIKISKGNYDKSSEYFFTYDRDTNTLEQTAAPETFERVRAIRCEERDEETHRFYLTDEGETVWLEDSEIDTEAGGLSLILPADIEREPAVAEASASALFFPDGSTGYIRCADNISGLYYCRDYHRYDLRRIAPTEAELSADKVLERQWLSLQASEAALENLRRLTAERELPTPEYGLWSVYPDWFAGCVTESDSGLIFYVTVSDDDVYELLDQACPDCDFTVEVVRFTGAELEHLYYQALWRMDELKLIGVTFSIPYNAVRVELAEDTEENRRMVMEALASDAVVFELPDAPTADVSSEPSYAVVQRQVRN